MDLVVKNIAYQDDEFRYWCVAAPSGLYRDWWDTEDLFPAGNGNGNRSSYTSSYRRGTRCIKSKLVLSLCQNLANYHYLT